MGGQLLYILFTSVAFTAVLWLLSWVFLLPNLEWGADWGPSFDHRRCGRRAV